MAEQAQRAQTIFAKFRSNIDGKDDDSDAYYMQTRYYCFEASCFSLYSSVVPQRSCCEFSAWIICSLSIHKMHSRHSHAQQYIQHTTYYIHIFTNSVDFELHFLFEICKCHCLLTFPIFRSIKQVKISLLFFVTANSYKTHAIWKIWFC